MGTRSEIPVSFPVNSGSTVETAFAAPVVVGMTFPSTALPLIMISYNFEQYKPIRLNTCTSITLAVAIKHIL